MKESYELLAQKAKEKKRHLWMRLFLALLVIAFQPILCYFVFKMWSPFIIAYLGTLTIFGLGFIGHAIYKENKMALLNKMNLLVQSYEKHMPSLMYFNQTATVLLNSLLHCQLITEDVAKNHSHYYDESNNLYLVCNSMLPTEPLFIFSLHDKLVPVGFFHNIGITDPSVIHKYISLNTLQKTDMINAQKAIHKVVSFIMINKGTHFIHHLEISKKLTALKFVLPQFSESDHDKLLAYVRNKDQHTVAHHSVYLFLKDVLIHSYSHLKSQPLFTATVAGSK